MNLAPDLLALAQDLEAQGRTDEAIAVYSDLVLQHANDACMRQSLGLLYVAKNQTAQAAELFRQAVALDPEQASFRNNYGAALAELGNAAQALENFEAAIRLKPDHAEAHKSLGMTYLQLGDFQRGWAEFEWRWRCQDFRPRAFSQPAWNGADCRGQTILLYTEQGIGDTFQFIRYVPLMFARGARVIVEAPAPLLPLLSTCLGIAQTVAHGSKLPRFDFHAAVMSLPRLFGTTVDTVPANSPYLKADPRLVERWRPKFAARQRFKIGIVWQGNPQNASDFRRSIPLEHFRPLVAVPGIELFSLQKGVGAEQLANVDFPIIDLGPGLDLGAFRVSAAILNHLDLLVSCDTAAAHLAGAMDKPVWLALSYAADWRWLLERQDSPWYPSMRLFRQPKLGDWTSVFAAMAAALTSLVERKTAVPDTVNDA